MEMKDVWAHTWHFDRVIRVLESPVQLSPLEGGNPKLTKAIWDTGAVGSVIDERLAAELQLTPVYQTSVRTMYGVFEARVYDILLEIMETVRLPLRVVGGYDLSDDGSIGFLIGMDVISLGDFSLSNHEGKTTLSFRVPSMGGMDYTKPDEPQTPVLSAPESQWYL